MNKHQIAAKKYLSQAFGLNQRIESKLGQIEELHNLATKATVTYSDMPRNPNKGHSRLEEEGYYPQDQSCGEYRASDSIGAQVSVLYEMGRDCHRAGIRHR